MNKVILFIMSVLIASPSFGQSASDLVKKGNAAMKSMNEPLALKEYEKALKINPNSIPALCGASFMSSRVGNRQAKKANKVAYFKKAKAYAQKAVKKAPTSSTANYVMAVAMGRMALISGSKDKVAASRDIKKYADKAIKLNPKNAKAWSVLGVWNLAVANLNFAEKGAANLLFGGIPDGDLATAIKCFEKCKKLDPSYIPNYLELGKAYKQSKKTELAKAALKKGLSLPNKAQDDPSNKAKMKKLLATL